MKKERKGRILEKRTNFLISTVDLHVRAVSVFGEKSDAVCGFFGVFLIGYGTPFTPPSLRNQMQRWFCSLQNPKYKGICSVFFSWATGIEGYGTSAKSRKCQRLLPKFIEPSRNTTATYCVRAAT